MQDCKQNTAEEQNVQNWNTVEPLNKGHLGNWSFVLLRAHTKEKKFKDVLFILIHTCVHLDMLNIIEKLYIHSELSIVYMHYWGYNGGDTIFTSESCMGYRIH